MKILYFYLVTMFTLNIANAQWIQKSSMYDNGRVSAIGCTSNGRGYVGLGQIADGTYINDLWEYEPLSNIWIKKADFPGGGRNGAVAYSIKGKIYVCFGFDNSHKCNNDIWEFNPLNNTWTRKAVFPGQARYNARGFVMSDSLLYIGTGTYNVSNNYLDDFWMYNPSNNTWTQKANFPGSKRMAAASFEINGFGFLGCGLYDSNTPKKDFWKYNPANDNWTSISDFPATARVGQVSFVINNEGYVGTGDDYSNINIDFWKYNPSKESWVHVASPPTEVRLSGISFTIGNIGYIGTGWNKSIYFSDMWAFNPDDSEINDILKCKIYPIPAKTSITIEFSQSPKETAMTIYNVIGQEFIIQKLVNTRTNIDIQDLASGIYFVKLINDKVIEVRKIIKE
jgi:N-acetylneuraminic acid mutarotase